MMMKNLTRVLMSVAVLIATAIHTQAQTKTTEALSSRFENAMELYFYKNTLKMLNQAEDPAFDELIKDIEKMKFLMVDKSTDNFGPADFKKLKGDYVKEEYEEMVTSRVEGRTFDVYIREDKGRVMGTVILVSDSTNLYVLDILGRVAIHQASALFNTLDESSDIGKKIKDFVGDGDRKKNHFEH